MTTYFNRSEGEFTPQVQNWNPIQMIDHEPAPEQHGGLFFRARQYPELKTQIDACLGGQLPYAELSLDAYQAWNERGWKKQHGSLETVRRFGGKAREESGELSLAYDDWLEEKDDYSRHHVIEETGDVLWVTTAQANNSGTVLSDNLKRRLFDYASGTRWMQNGEKKYPDWYEAAGALALKRGSITLGEIDALTNQGFVAQMSPAMNLFEDHRELSGSSYMYEVSLLSMMLETNGAMQHDTETRGVLGYEHSQLAQQAGVIAAEVILRLAGVAYKVGGTLAEAAQENMTKIEHRIQAGQIDKTDGNR